MTDHDLTGSDPIDARLRAAGAAWREQHRQGAVVDVAALPAIAGRGAPAPAGDDVVDIAPVAPGPPRRRGRWIAAVLTAAALVAAVVIGLVLTRSGGGTSRRPAPAGGVVAAGLTGLTWQLVSVRSGGTTTAMAPGPAFLAFDAAGGVKGHDGCNYLFGPVTLHGTQLSFGDIASTAMGCLDPNAARPVIDAVLSGTVEFTVKDAVLTLTKPGVGTLVYTARRTPVPVTDPAVLSGTHWQLDSITTGTGDGAVSSGSSQYATRTLAFDDRGGIVAFDGCNSMSGPAAFGNGTGTIGPLVSTARACPYDPVGQLVGSVLDGSVRWSVSGDRLTISKSGVGSLTYVR
ncbi:MAG: META domain-containing protein [Jatrophihabitans sp.]|nr:MAG: META domain-containing protein [Jatrophihabitans sp.]